MVVMTSEAHHKGRFLGRVGLVLINGRIGYGVGHGWFLGWPQWFHRLLAIWNPISCRILGHDVFDYGWIGRDEKICIHCHKLTGPSDYTAEELVKAREEFRAEFEDEEGG